MESRVTNRNIAVVLFRVLGVYSLIRGIDSLSYNIIMFFSNQQVYGPGKFVQLIGPTFVLLACGVVLWLTAPTISLWASKDPGRENEHSISFNDGLAKTAFSAVGVFIIVDTIPIIMYQLGHCILLLKSSVSANYVLGETGSVFGASIVKLLLGISLVIGSKRVARIIRATRTGTGL